MFARKMMVFAAVVMVVVMASGCMVGGQFVEGSGRTVTKDYDFSDFSKLQVGSAFKLDVRQGDSYSVSVTVDDNMEEFLDVKQTGDTVQIGLEPRVSLGFRNMTLKATVTMPELSGLDISGAARATMTGFEMTKDVAVEASGASKLSGDLSAGELTVKASGASTVEIEGRATGLRAEASGASTLRLENVQTGDARVNASGASRISVNASGELTGDASGASTVEYEGKPASVRVDTSGASNVRQR